MPILRRGSEWDRLRTQQACRGILSVPTQVEGTGVYRRKNCRWSISRVKRSAYKVLDNSESFPFQISKVVELFADGHSAGAGWTHRNFSIC